ncbi:class I SAM-dependent methyltransferase [Paenibacillus turpanensis]|uniref:class I SAM-dependent methyltransferase n=1 Tax=Paenibacillus turpanensis TaxID=2689078 RepID=UPI00140A21AF|nr:class I SAM-dependent methyltransferase [Paenibacillus turpanensis]
MNFGTKLHGDYKKAWIDGMRDWNNRMPERMVDDRLEEQFWQEYLERRKKKPEPHAYAVHIMEELLPLLQSDDSVLEIGPGWGNYTFEAARRVKQYSCFDSSKSVLTYLQEAAAASWIDGMEFLHGKWEEYAAEADAYDVVFGINCFYRMQDIDRAMLNMNRAARRLAVVGMTSGPEPAHLWEIHRKLGYRMKFTRRDYIYITNVLYQLGIDVNCRIIPLERTYSFDSVEQFIEEQLKKIVEPEFDRVAVERIVSSYIEDIDGKPGYRHRFKAALLYWRPEAELPALQTHKGLE